MPVTSSNSTPVLTATKLSVMKLMERAGLMKILAINSFRSITAAVLFDSSQTTLKSVIPLRPFTSLKTGSTILTNSALVNSSLNSKSTFSAALEIALSSTKKSRRTLIRSNAEGLPRPVLSPKRTSPCPGILATGLTPAL